MADNCGMFRRWWIWFGGDQLVVVTPWFALLIRDPDGAFDAMNYAVTSGITIATKRNGRAGWFTKFREIMLRYKDREDYSKPITMSGVPLQERWLQ